MRRALAALLLAAPLAGCAAVPDLDERVAVYAQRKADANDSAARLSLRLLCNTSVGAFYRELSDAQRRLVAEVCGGGEPVAPVPTPPAPAEPPVEVDPDTLPRMLPARDAP